MKLKLTAVAVALAALAPVANASVQPSFNDNAPIVGAASTIRSGVTVSVPQPSFNDNAPVTAEIATPVTGTLVSEGGTPAPSFNG
jgi:hypothetical protein